MASRSPNIVMMSNVWYIIPARKGSKGMPLKNRKLLQFTVDTIPIEKRKSVIVTSNDLEIEQQVKSQKMVFHNRSEQLSSDTASTRDVLLDVIDQYQIPKSDIVVLLYLTYPSRTWNDIQRAVDTLAKANGKSLLCKKQLDSSPYLMMFDTLDGKGKKIIDHDFCRRQDYSPCFLMSHFVGVFYANEVSQLDTNLWNRDTIFMPISNKIDVDYQEDLRRYLSEKKDES